MRGTLDEHWLEEIRAVWDAVSEEAQTVGSKALIPGLC